MVRWLTCGLLIVAVGIISLIAVYFSRSITRPISQGVDLAKALADGNLTRNLAIDRGDEIGAVIDLVFFKKMDANALEMSATSSGAVKSATELSHQTESISETMNKATFNLNTVATSADQMAIMINEIAKNSEKAHDITIHAVQHSNEPLNQV